MEGRPCRAACFDWDFRNVAITAPAEREGIFNERQRFVMMIKNLNFTIYPSEKEVKVTRNLPKRNFIKELKKCEYRVSIMLNYKFCLYVDLIHIDMVT